LQGIPEAKEGIVSDSADYAKVDIEFLEKVKAESSVAMSND